MLRERYDVIVVGGGVAGGSCIETLRGCGYDGSVALLAAEEHPPYHRPPLTKGFLRGEQQEPDTWLETEEWYVAHGVELLEGCEVTAIETAGRTLTLGDGDDARQVGYGTLVLATGATPRVPAWEGDGDRAGRLFTIRTIEDSERVREHLHPGAKWVIVGGGYIGVEAAASALQRGCEVELLLTEPVLWTQFYGDEVGGYFQRRLGEHGAKVHTEETVTRLDVEAEGVRVTTARGATFEGDYVLAGIGVTPNLDVARAAGLEVDEGVLCDRFLQASQPHVYVAGDIAQYDSVVHGRRMRIEHWDVARSQGAYVGRRIAGVLDEGQPYDDVPYFFSQLGDWLKMRYVGPGMGEVFVRGSMADDAFAAAYVKDDRLVALLAVDHDDDLETARELLMRHPRVDRARLADDSVPLREALLL